MHHDGTNRKNRNENRSLPLAVICFPSWPLLKVLGTVSATSALNYHPHPHELLMNKGQGRVEHAVELAGSNKKEVHANIQLLEGS